MPRKDKEEYRRYMRNYMRGRYKYNRENPDKAMQDFDATEVETEAPKKVPEIKKENVAKAGSVTKMLMKDAREIFKDEEGNPDKALVLIERAAKYAPLVSQLAAGFMERMKEAQIQQAASKEQNGNVPEPPPGWLEMNPLDRLKRMYDGTGQITPWYQAGLQYDEFMSGGRIHPRVNIDQEPPAARRGQGRPSGAQTETQYRNLSELSRKYAGQEPPVIDPNEPPKNVEQPKQEIPEKNTETEAAPQHNEINKAQQLTAVLNQDIVRYIDMGADYINKMPDKDFKKYCKNPSQLLNKLNQYKLLVPVHLRDGLLNTPVDQMENLFRLKCPEKFKLAEKGRMVGKLRKMFKETQDSFKEPEAIISDDI